MAQAKQVVKRVFFLCSIGAIVTALILALGLGRWIVTHVYHDEVLATLMPLAAGWLIITALQQLLVDTFRGFQRFDDIPLPARTAPFDEVSAQVKQFLLQGQQAQKLDQFISQMKSRSKVEVLV